MSGREQHTSNDVEVLTPRTDEVGNGANTVEKHFGISETTNSATSTFWAEGSYKKICKRIEEGAKLCEDVAKMVADRADIEILYANKLKGWRQKWSEHFRKSPEYGSLAKGIDETFTEADAVGSYHVAFQKKSLETARKISEWRSANYHRALVSWKEVKRSEDAFGKAQKPWITKRNEVQKCTKTYHQCCHSNDLLAVQLKGLGTSAEPPPETTRKLKEKKMKCDLDKDTALEKYKDSLRDLNSYKAKYQEDMKHEFDRCQAAEETRKQFIRQSIVDFFGGLDRSIFNSDFDQTHKNVTSALAQVDPAKDISEYRDQHGPCNEVQDIEFKEYNAAMHAGQFEKGGKMQTSGGQAGSLSPKKSSICTTL